MKKKCPGLKVLKTSPPIDDRLCFLWKHFHFFVQTHRKISVRVIFPRKSIRSSTKGSFKKIFQKFQDSSFWNSHKKTLKNLLGIHWNTFTSSMDYFENFPRIFFRNYSSDFSEIRPGTSLKNIFRNYTSFFYKYPFEAIWFGKSLEEFLQKLRLAFIS